MGRMKSYYHDEIMERESEENPYLEMNETDYDIIEPALTNEPSNFTFDH